MSVELEREFGDGNWFQAMISVGFIMDPSTTGAPYSKNYYAICLCIDLRTEFHVAMDILASGYVRLF